MALLATSLDQNAAVRAILQGDINGNLREVPMS